MWHDVFYFVRHEDLVAVELDLIALNINVILDAWEVENTRQVEWIVHIEMNMEKRLVHLMRVELMVEILVVFLREVSRFACPGWVDVVDDILLACFHLFAVFPLLFHTKDDLHWEELAVFGEQAFDSGIFQVLSILVIDMEYNLGAALGFDGILHGIFR